MSTFRKFIYQFLQPLSLTTVLIILIFSCNKNQEEASPNALAISQAQLIYNEIQPSISKKFSQKFTLSPQWNKTKFEQLDNDLSVLYIPLAKDKNTGNSLELLILNKKDSPLKSQIIERIPEKDYFIKNGFPSNYVSFDGIINFFTLSGEFMIGGIYAKGNLIEKYIPIEELKTRGARIATEGDGWAWEVNGPEVIIIGHRPETPTTLVYIVIPTSIFIPTGGTYQGFVYTTTVTNGSGFMPIAPGGGSNFSPGQIPLEDHPTKCAGLQALWTKGINNANKEVAGVITLDNHFLVTEVISGQIGGAMNGMYEHQGQLYYYYPKGANPVPNYQGVKSNPTGIFIPIKATIHSHTPCVNTPYDGVTNQQSADDSIFAARFPQAPHYVLGCGGILGQYTGGSSSFYNIQQGPISSSCQFLP